MDTKKFTGLKVLNQLSLTDKEEETILVNFTKMSMEESKLADYPMENIEPMVHNIDLINVLREDKQIKNFTRDELQEDAPEKMDGYWQVPRLVE